MERRHTISALVENQHGVLAKISGMFAARGFNINSLTVGPTRDPSISRMTIVVKANDRTLEQIVKQLDRLVTTIRVEDYVGLDVIERELVLVKVEANGSKRVEVMQIIDVFRGKIVDMNPMNLTVEVTGSEDKLSAFVEALRPYDITEFARSGKIAMARGQKTPNLVEESE